MDSVYKCFPACGRMPWETEVLSIDREDVIGGLDCSSNAAEFVRACWIFDYTVRLEADWMLGCAWFKE